MIKTVRPTLDQPENTTMSTQLSVKFWGVRGSVPTPTQANQRYGGNTLCIEINLAGQKFIFDGGTGIVSLGYHLLQQNKPIRAHIFFTHTQWDRIQGFPFFQPAFVPGNHFTLYGGTAPNGASIKHCLTDQMLQPHFALPLQNMQATLNFRTVSAGNRLDINGVQVEILKTNPATEALAYRLTWQDETSPKTIVYATDTTAHSVDENLLAFANQADIFVCDGTYTDLTYLRHNVPSKSAGQSNIQPVLEPWEPALNIAKTAGVKSLVLVHHSPVQTDTGLDQLQAELRDRFPATYIAYEGMTLTD